MEAFKCKGMDSSNVSMGQEEQGIENKPQPQNIVLNKISKGLGVPSSLVRSHSMLPKWKTQFSY